MTSNEKALPNAVVHIFDGARGIYIPQAFAQSCNEGWHGVSEENRETLLAGPEHEWYCDAWDAVLNNAYWEKDGFKWQLHQDGDLWAYCEAMMTSEEKRNFGMDVDPFEYVIDLDERGEFRATVYNDNGRVVFGIDGYDIFEDGFMEDKNDVIGLKEHLVSLGIMHKDDTLIM
jgi:hypothetical protein